MPHCCPARLCAAGTNWSLGSKQSSNVTQIWIWVQFPFFWLRGLRRTHGRHQDWEDLLNFSNIFYRSIIRANLLSFWELLCRFPTCTETDVTTFAVWIGALKWVNKQTAEWISYLEGESWPLEYDTEEKHLFHTSSYLPLPGKQLFYNVGIKWQFLGGKQLSMWSKFFMSIRSDSLRGFKELITALLFLSRKKN